MLNRRNLLPRACSASPVLSRRAAWREAGFIPTEPGIGGALTAPFGAAVAAMVFGLVAFSVAGEIDHHTAGKTRDIQIIANAAPDVERPSADEVSSQAPEIDTRIGSIWVAGLISSAPAHAQQARPYGKPASRVRNAEQSLRLASVIDWASGIVLPDDKAVLMQELASEAGTDTSNLDLGSDEPEDLALLFDETPVDVSDEITCLAQNIYFEARSEPDLGKLGVAFVVMNRVASKRFPDSVCKVVRQGGEEHRHRCQFSWWCDGKSDSPANFSSWSESLKIAGDVYWGRQSDPTSGALWYHADYVAPSWSKVFDRGPKIGRHIFYGPARDKGQRPQLASRELD